MGKENKQPFVSENVIKPRQLIQIERKAPKMAQEVFNVLLKHAWPQIKERKKHSIPLKDIFYYVPSATNVAHLRKQLEALAIKVQFNIFDRVKTNRTEDGYFVLLPEANIIIEDGVGRIEYSFTHTMIEIFMNKLMYAKINLLIQRQFKGGKYGLDLYELCFDYKKIKATPFLTVQELKKYFGVEEQKTYAKFKYFNLYVLEKAVKDVNTYTDLIVRIEKRKQGRNITHVRFHIAKKEGFNIGIPALGDLPEEQKREKAEQQNVAEAKKGMATDLDMNKELEKFGASAAYRKTVISEYSKEEIEEALQVGKEEEARNGVKYPDKFLKRALEEGWQSKAGIQKRKQLELEERRLREKDAEEREEKRRAEEREREKEQYANSSNEERLEYVLKNATGLGEAYDALTPGQQESFREHAYWIFENFDNFGMTYQFFWNFLNR